MKKALDPQSSQLTGRVEWVDPRDCTAIVPPTPPDVSLGERTQGLFGDSAQFKQSAVFV